VQNEDPGGTFPYGLVKSICHKKAHKAQKLFLYPFVLYVPYCGLSLSATVITD
jgi:hypothetical protein